MLATDDYTMCFSTRKPRSFPAMVVLLLCRLLASSGAAAASAPGGTRAVSWFFPEGSEDGCASGPANGTAEISIGDAPLSRPVVSCLVPGLHTHYLFCQVMPANATSASRNETV